MEKTETKNAFSFIKADIGIQEILSLGYIYLLILGIISETIYYRFFEINILKHSSILDVLLSPIALLTSNWMLPVLLVVILLIVYVYNKFIGIWLHNKYKSKDWYQKNFNVEKLDKAYKRGHSSAGMVFLIFLMTFSMLIGFGIGSGNKRSDKMKKGTLKPNKMFVFQNGDSIRVRVIGQNSLYYFYVVENERDLTISPVSQNILKIKLLSSEEKDK